jgi:hypothetical protein
LIYDSPKGFHRQIVVGVKEAATNGFDLGYDAFIIDINEEDMYWVFDENKFVIQGVNNFNKTQEFPLGLIVQEPGTIKIRIDAIENVDANLHLFIKDNETGMAHQINKNKAFELPLESGTYNDRFKLVFQPKLVVDNNSTKEANNAIYHDSKTKEIKAIGINELDIINATLYNVIGQSIIELIFNAEKTSQRISVNPGVYIVQINTLNGIINRKVIIK